MAWWGYTLVKTKEIVGFQDDNDLNEKALKPPHLTLYGCGYDMM
jgi:hypothetical protein